ncbi:hypothetical protein CANCADRAFT_30179 [Tortispora caseinolytica NRRL Y-17796]|uniref:Protein STU1 n=1 Tax=Tortispora caseinolytica NRRL Y-17796 TaxID=767744 RepID=A0A1E4TJN0_9ASCO|nr:hypothetical protein CANCADRAFT_30179 [Tortispora caseinolytica NRRL Y-17796]
MISADVLLRIIQTSTPIDSKVKAIDTFKGNVKKEVVNLPDVPTYFEALFAALQLDVVQLNSLTFSALCHLIRRVSIQDSSYLSEYTDAVVPILLDRLGSSKESIVKAAHKALHDYWLSCPGPVENIVRLKGLSGSLQTQYRCLKWLSEIITLRPGFAFRPYTSIVAAQLNQPQPVSDAAASLLISFFKNASHPAKLDLQKKMLKAGVNPAISFPILQEIGVGTRSVSGSTSHTSAANATRTASNPPKQISYSLSEFLSDIPNTSIDNDSIAPIYISSEEQLDAIFTDHIAIFSNKESEANWNARERFIIQLRGILKANSPPDDPVIFGVFFRNLLDAITKAIHSLRTTLSNNAVQLVKEAAVTLSVYLDPVADALLHNLLKITSTTKKISVQQAQGAIAVLLTRCSYSQKIINTLAAAVNEKIHTTRLTICSCISLIILSKGQDTSSLSNANGLGTISTMLGKLLADPNSSVRESARSSFWIFRSFFTPQADQLYESLDLNTKKALDKSRPTIAEVSDNFPEFQVNNSPGNRRVVSLHVNSHGQQRPVHAPSHSETRIRTEFPAQESSSIAHPDTTSTLTGLPAHSENIAAPATPPRSYVQNEPQGGNRLADSALATQPPSELPILSEIFTKVSSPEVSLRMQGLSMLTKYVDELPEDFVLSIRPLLVASFIDSFNDGKVSEFMLTRNIMRVLAAVLQPDVLLCCLFLYQAKSGSDALSSEALTHFHQIAPDESFICDTSLQIITRSSTFMERAYIEDPDYQHLIISEALSYLKSVIESPGIHSRWVAAHTTGHMFEPTLLDLFESSKRGSALAQVGIQALLEVLKSKNPHGYAEMYERFVREDSLVEVQKELSELDLDPSANYDVSDLKPIKLDYTSSSVKRGNSGPVLQESERSVWAESEAARVDPYELGNQTVEAFSQTVESLIEDIEDRRASYKTFWTLTSLIRALSVPKALQEATDKENENRITENQELVLEKGVTWNRVYNALTDFLLHTSLDNETLNGALVSLNHVLVKLPEDNSASIADRLLEVLMKYVEENAEEITVMACEELLDGYIERITGSKKIELLVICAERAELERRQQGFILSALARCLERSKKEEDLMLSMDLQMRIGVIAGASLGHPSAKIRRAATMVSVGLYMFAQNQHMVFDLLGGNLGAGQRDLLQFYFSRSEASI